MKILSKLTKSVSGVSTPNTVLRYTPMYLNISSGSYAIANGGIGSGTIIGYSNITLLANTVYAAPIVLSNSTTINLLNTYRSDLLNNNFRFGIYSSNSSGAPNTLLLSGNLLGDTSNRLGGITVNYTLKGYTLYWLACLSDIDVTVLSSYTSKYMGTIWTGSTFIDVVSIKKNQAYASGLPDPFGSFDYNDTLPILAVRAA